MNQSFGAFYARRIDGSEQPLEDYQNLVVLVVNTASACGFTPQYAGLEALHRNYRARGFTVLAFPCNQFGAQEPGDAATIAQFCESRFGVSFPLFDKIEVNGENAHPLFVWLKHLAPGVLGSEAVKWNFTKFLVARDGRTVRRYAPATRPEELAADIEALLAA